MNALLEQCKREQETLEMLEVNEDEESDAGYTSPSKVGEGAVVPYQDYNVALTEAKELLAELEEDMKQQPKED